MRQWSDRLKVKELRCPLTWGSDSLGLLTWSGVDKTLPCSRLSGEVGISLCGTALFSRSFSSHI